MSATNSCIFATLEPRNLAARIAFSNAVEESQRQPPPAWSKFMQARPCKEYDAEYAQQSESWNCNHESDSAASATEPDTDIEDYRKDTYLLWAGCFVFELSDLEKDPSWIAGTGRGPLKSDVQFKLVGHNIRRWHVKFFFTDNGFIGLTPATTHAKGLSVDDNPIESRSHHLNESHCNIRIVDLCYHFTYTDYARSPDFHTRRKQFWIAQRRRRLEEANIAELSLTPIPAEQATKIGKYVLSTEIGKGASGRVYSATDTTGAVFAIKKVELHIGSVSSIEEEINALEEITRKAKETGCINVVRLKEVMGDYKSMAVSSPFRTIHFVYETAAHCTIDKIVTPDTNVPLRVRLCYLQDILSGLQFLHQNCWIHRDIKESNIGIYHGRAVILDFGSAHRLQSPRATLRAEPGTCGTIGYLAPELEMPYECYGCDIDIWAAGIVGYVLAYLKHPLNISRNPWREGNENLRGLFHRYYRSMYIDLMFEDPDVPKGINGLLLGMFRADFKFLECNHGTRITAEQALTHTCWEGLTKDDKTPSVKRLKQ